jgi:hypothetical protein
VTDALAEVYALLDAAERLLASEREQRWCPHKPFKMQEAFLARDELEVLYGGAAGGGKSDALLMAALQHVDVPSYSALILRKTYKDLALAGAIMDRAGEWWRPTAARWNDNDKRWTFPSGATITFGYMESLNDRFRYQSAEFQCVCFDELTHFHQVQYTYMFSRLRKASDDLAHVPLRMRAGTNPGGVGHEWVGKRFGIRPDGTQDVEKAHDPKTGQLRVFVPSRLEDNPYVDSSYETSLSSLDETTYAQLRRGVWITDNAGLVLPITRDNLVDLAPRGLRCVLGIDLGSSESEETLALAVVGWMPGVPDRAWVVHAEKHTAMLTSDLAVRIRELDERFRFEAMVMDEGALGKQFGKEVRARFRLPVTPARKENRVGYAKLYRDAARGASQPEERQGVARLYVHADDAAELVTEAAELLWHGNGRDMVGKCHAYDASLYAWRRALAWLEEVPEEKPKPGTPEHAESERVRLQIEATRRMESRGKGWWKR